MAQATLTESKVLVERVWGRNYTPMQLRKWIAKIWGNLLLQLPGILSLSRGWFDLIFSHLDQVDWVISQYLHIEMTPMLLKIWLPMFDPEKENHGPIPIWVRLPTLPLQFQAEEIFKVIGDDLGVYLDHDRTYQDIVCLALARILVHLDTIEGLVESYLLQMGDITR